MNDGIVFLYCHRLYSVILREQDSGADIADMPSS